MRFRWRFASDDQVDCSNTCTANVTAIAELSIATAYAWWHVLRLPSSATAGRCTSQRILGDTQLAWRSAGLAVISCVHKPATYNCTAVSRDDLLAGRL